MLELRDVTRIVDGSTHIDAVSLTLRPGTLNVLLGPTLSGKTSLMRLMAGLDRPTSGRVLAEGRDVTGVPVRRRNIAMVYQQFINYPAMTVYENIASPLRVAGADRATVDREVRRAAELMKLTPMLGRLPLELSGGQQQRTALARAVVKKAGLVLLDEPLANLDYKLREELRAELPKLFAESGAIYVYATTEPTEALLLGGNTATLHEGRVTQFGRTIDVFRRPADLTSARIFADPPLNVAPATKRGAAFVLRDGATVAAPDPGLPDGDYTLGVRAHHLSRATGAGPDAIAARVIVTEITGSESFVHVEAEGSRWVMLTHGVHPFEPGETLSVRIDTRHLMVFAPDGRAVGHERAQAA
ncbi:MAG: ABC transporter ATP-binding protein [Rhodobacteraceae bacterium]|nr:MAG: ABC transporter ATP-binding protein [Paracoccaceae bacterium]